MFAICHVSGCDNAGAPILVPDDAEAVVCGPCGQPITDISAAPPTQPEEIPSWLE